MAVGGTASTSIRPSSGKDFNYYEGLRLSPPSPL